MPRTKIRIKKGVPKLIVAVLEKKNMTPYDLLSMVDLSRYGLYALVNYKAIPSLPSAYAISRALQVEVEDLWPPDIFEKEK